MGRAEPLRQGATRVITRECNLGDIMYASCDLREDDWDQIVKLGSPRDIDMLVSRCYGLPGPKWAMTAESAPNEALVVCGFVPLRDGVYSTWFMATSKAWSEYAEAVTTLAAERLRWALDSGAHRLETLCLSSRERAHRWYTKIGLRHESTLKGYCVDGSDAVMYVRLKGDA